MKLRRMREAARVLARAVRRRWALAAAAACALAALSAAARVLAPPAALHAADFPAVRPAHLAHLLADISANMHPIPGSWSLEEEAGNYSWWRYAVSYSCGARCAGRVAVAAAAGGGGGAQLRHGAADLHRVTLSDTRCSTLPLLPWPQLCEEVKIESVVSAVGAGSRLQETVRSRCGAAAAALRACASSGALQQRARARAAHLRRLLPAPRPPPAAAA